MVTMFICGAKICSDYFISPLFSKTVHDVVILRFKMFPLRTQAHCLRGWWVSPEAQGQGICRDARRDASKQGHTPRCLRGSRCQIHGGFGEQKPNESECPVGPAWHSNCRPRAFIVTEQPGEIRALPARLLWSGCLLATHIHWTQKPVCKGSWITFKRA